MLFAHLRPGAAVSDLFRLVDWSGATKRQLIHAFLDRAPANGLEAEQLPGFDPYVEALELFGSLAFRQDLAVRLLRAYPHKRRVLFVHIPKSAGTDFTAAMRETLPHITKGFESLVLFSNQQLANALRNFAKKITRCDSIFLGGHIKLAWYLDANLYRLRDRLIAIVRDPHEICVSFANYVVHRFKTFPDLSAQDTSIWAAGLGMTAHEISQIPPEAFALALTTRPGIQPINPICSLLGDGTAAGAFDNLQRATIEVTSADRYSEWLRQSWSIERDRRVNSSPRLVGWHHLSAWQQAKIAAGCQEDRVLYGAVMAALENTAANSVTSEEILAAWNTGSQPGIGAEHDF